MSELLHARWLELIEAIDRECWAHGQYPGDGVLEVNESTLKVSLPLNGGERCARKFREQEILKGDLKTLASEFYAACKAERDQA